MGLARIREETAEWFTLANPILRDHEIGLEIDTRKFKFGDNRTHWNELNYSGGDTGGGTGNPDAVVRVLKQEDTWPDRPDVNYVEWVGPGDPDPPNDNAGDTWVVG